MGKRGNIAAKRGLFEIDELLKLLNKSKVERFHHIVSKLLFVSKRARVDIDLEISLLCTRVSKSTEEGLGKTTKTIKLHIIYSQYAKIIDTNEFEVL